MSGLGWLKGIPALRQILRICLYSKDSSEHTAARSVIRAFCLQNLEGQSMLTSTLLPAADSNPGDRLHDSYLPNFSLLGHNQ